LAGMRTAGPILDILLTANIVGRTHWRLTGCQSFKGCPPPEVIASVVHQRLCVLIRYWLAGVCGLILAR